MYFLLPFYPSPTYDDEADEDVEDEDDDDDEDNGDTDWTSANVPLCAFLHFFCARSRTKC